VKATVDLAAHLGAAEQEAATEQGLDREPVTGRGPDQERAEQVPGRAQVAEQDLDGEPEQAEEREAATAQGLDREQAEQVPGRARVAE
jgi:hypothetical protein